MVFSHAFAGAALTQLALSKHGIKLSQKKKGILYFVGITSAVLPDFDIALLLLDNTIKHRALLSHSFLPYVLIVLTIWIASQISQSKFLGRLAIVFMLGSFSHILIDFLAGGVAIWAPFSYEIVGIPLRLPSAPFAWIKGYITSEYMIAELALFLFYLKAIRGDANRVLKALPIFFFIIATSALFGLALFIY